ncbi:uncharacterized protein OCT59_015268 [Rhizophagus irregularis]|uniref:uncharacterized protein n=1 Tax=Rhizophagus irregularis TaxID=588596 RepID=UPI0019D8D261|nr:hypothetical protein OCT59_015268 [Rhizophagus irregularis]GBC18871.2 hypothetical protein RIR_jg6227.t1 [Rhizophagus irregularis DAOM 181602=DAOM 197198]
MRLNPPIDINTRPMGIPRSRLTIKSLFNIRLSLLSAVATTPQDIDIPDDLKPFVPNSPLYTTKMQKANSFRTRQQKMIR